MQLCFNKSRLRHVAMAAASSGSIIVFQQPLLVLPFALHTNLNPPMDQCNIYHNLYKDTMRMYSSLKDIQDPSTYDPSNEKSKKKKINSKKSNKKKNMDDESFRVERVVSFRACLSRSEAGQLIQSRRVAYKELNDDDTLIPIKSTKLKIPMNSIIYVNGRPLPPIPPLLMVYHKPKNVLSAMDEKHSVTKKHLGMMVPESYKKYGMHPVGRLDYDTSGLILFSRDGDLTQRLLHPKYEVEKEYVATVAGGPVDTDLLKKRLEENGVETTEGIHFAKVVNVENLELLESQSILSKHMKCLEGEGVEEKDERIVAAVNRDDGHLFNVRLVVQEGKYRMVRRMLANCGHPVVELKRERHGHVQLKDLGIGEFRDCNEEELEWANGLL